MGPNDHIDSTRQSENNPQTSPQSTPERSDVSYRTRKRMKSSLDFMLNNNTTTSEATSPTRTDAPQLELPVLPSISTVLSIDALRNAKVGRLATPPVDPNLIQSSSGFLLPRGRTATSSVYITGQPQTRRPLSHASSSSILPMYPQHAHQRILPQRASYGSMPAPHVYFQMPAGYSQMRNQAIPVISTPRSAPTSRTASVDNLDDRHPKLKYSHKIAERKRRKDMNDTFDELKATLPNRGAKMSKWEILMTAAEYIDELHATKQKLVLERETLHRELGLPVVDMVKTRK